MAGRWRSARGLVSVISWVCAAVLLVLSFQNCQGGFAPADEVQVIGSSVEVQDPIPVTPPSDRAPLDIPALPSGTPSALPSSTPMPSATPAGGPSPAPSPSATPTSSPSPTPQPATEVRLSPTNFPAVIDKPSRYEGDLTLSVAGSEALSSQVKQGEAWVCSRGLIRGSGNELSSDWLTLSGMFYFGGGCPFGLQLSSAIIVTSTLRITGRLRLQGALVVQAGGRLIVEGGEIHLGKVASPGVMATAGALVVSPGGMVVLPSARAQFGSRNEGQFGVWYHLGDLVFGSGQAALARQPEQASYTGAKLSVEIRFDSGLPSDLKSDRLRIGKEAYGNSDVSFVRLGSGVFDGDALSIVETKVD